MANNQSGNLNGRSKGSKNKSTQIIRESIQQLVENNIESILETLDSMNPIDKMKYIIDLLKPVLPKLRPVEHFNSTKENVPSIDFGKLFNFK